MKMEKNLNKNQTPTKLSEVLNFGKSDKSVFDEPVPVCPKCGEPKGFDIVILGKLRRMPVMCKCDDERVKKYEMNEKRKEIERRLDRFRSYSLMDKNFEDSTFENWQFNEYNKVMYTLGKRYCENWETMEENNRGLIMWGEAGNGKTYLSFAIANELVGKIALLSGTERKRAGEYLRVCHRKLKELAGKRACYSFLPSGYCVKVRLFAFWPWLYVRLYRLQKNRKGKSA